MRYYYGSSRSNRRYGGYRSRRREYGRCSYYPENEFFYGRSNEPLQPWERGYYRRLRRDQSPPAPEPPKEELEKALKVESVDFLVEENAVKHKTDKYDHTQNETRERIVDGKTVKLGPECIVRRGDSMKMKINLNRDYKKKIDDLSLKLKLGDRANEVKGTAVTIPLEESGDKKYKHDEWGANLIAEGKTISVEMFIPSNCCVGKWKVYIQTKTEKKDKKFNYDPKDGITILFNPWCHKDLVHCELDLNEYVLNDAGFVYKGSSNKVYGSSWVFGQFADKILDCSLMLMDKGFKSDFEGSWNPIKVSRILAAMVNESDDNGVLIGNWSGKYEGGTRPTAWIGSKNILKDYFDTMEPVKYGQCWVFSGVLTTVCRSLGLPCRSVTNYSSAHDVDRTLTIDTYYVDGEVYKFDTNDSCWNFHVWNEVYFARPDLPAGFDGWQAIDATPQELSDDIYTCGPASVTAIREGRVDLNYDTGFVFAEVNGDRVSWNLVPGQGWAQGNIRKNAVGKKISAKKAGHVELTGNRWRMRRLGKEMRDDLTCFYKYSEGSKEERKSVELAGRLAQNPIVSYDKGSDKVVPVTVDIHVSDDVIIGSDMTIDVDVKNHDSKPHTIDNGKMQLTPETYTGHTGDTIMTVPYDKDMPLTLAPGQSKKFDRVTVGVKKYFDHLLEENKVKIHVEMKMDKGSNKEKLIEADHEFEFEKPELDIESPPSVKRGGEAEFIVEFDNPLSEPLVGCKLSVQGGSFLDINEIKVPDVPPNGHFKQAVKVRATGKCKEKAEIVFEVDTDKLWDMKGETAIDIN